MSGKHAPVAERLERFRIRPADTAACWEWTGARNKKGYGHLGSNGKIRSAHRVAWELAHGPIPAGLHVLHRCDNPPCTNPAHLFLGTHAENMADKVAKGRQSRPQGEAHGMAVLTNETAAEIWGRLALGERGVDLAREFGVSPDAISHIRHGRKWAHLGQVAA